MQSKTYKILGSLVVITILIVLYALTSRPAATADENADTQQEAQ